MKLLRVDKQKMPMNAKATPFVQTQEIDKHNSFDFDLWVKQVKPQLLAALKKRGEK